MCHISSMLTSLGMFVVSFSLCKMSIYRKIMIKEGAYKVSNRPITTFSITLSPIICRTKAPAYVTILTSKLLAIHQVLIDFKKRQKLHFCNKNFENNFSFPDVFVFNIATTRLSSSYHLIQLFKYLLQNYVVLKDQKYWPLCQP